MLALSSTGCGLQAAHKAGKAAQMEHVALAFGQPRHRRGDGLMLTARQHLDRTGGQAVGRLQQADIAVEIIAVHNEGKPRMVQRFQHGRRVGVALVGHLKHCKQLAGHRQIDDPALVHGVVLLIFQTGDLDAVLLHQGAVAHQNTALVDPADIALAVDRLAVIDLGQQAAVLTQHVHKDIAQRGACLRQNGGRVDDGGVDMLRLDGLDTGERNAPDREEVTRCDLNDIDAPELANVAPAGDDRAHLRGTALHHAGRQSRQQRTGQRCPQTADPRHDRCGQNRVLAADDGKEEGCQTAAAQQPCKLLLVFVAGAACGTVGQKAAENLGRTADQHAGVRLGQTLRHSPERPGVLEPVGNGMLDLGADQLEVVTDGRSVQTAADGVQAQYQRRRACQHGEIGRVAAFGQHQDALQRRADCGQNGQAVRGGGLDQPPDAAEKRLPVGGAGCQQQHKHDRRVDHGIAQRGRAHRQHRQHDHDRSGHARHKAGHRGLCQLFGQLGAHRRGILGALILTAVGHGDLRRFKR